MFNQFTGIGNLAADVESRFTASGTQVCNLTVCCDYGYGDNKKTEFARCIAWDKLAAICEKYLHKGSKVFIQGTMETRQWEDQQGNKRYSTEIRLQTMKMLSPRNEGTNQGQNEAYPEHLPPGGGMGAEEDVPFAPCY